MHKTLKFFSMVALTTVLMASGVSAAQAQSFGGWRGGGPRRGGDMGPGQGMQCDDLARQVGGLQNQVAGLQSQLGGTQNQLAVVQADNLNLRAQLDAALGRTYIAGSFCYSACTDSWGTVDLRKTASGEGRSDLEAGQIATNATQNTFACSYSVKQVACEVVNSAREDHYCTAGCTDSWGTVDSRKTVGAGGRNVTEATFKALDLAQRTYSCSYSVKTVSCQ